MKKRLVAFLLVLIMVLGMLPVSAFAADDGVSPQALESNETQTIKYQILYVGDEFNIGYNYGASVNKTYTCQYSTGHSGFNHSILISEFRNVGVPALKDQLDSGYEFVGWAKEAKKNPTIYDFNTAGTTATQTTYTIYLVAKKTNPTPTYMYYLYYKYNDGTNSTWLTEQSGEHGTAATTFTFYVNTAKLKDRRGYEHIGWADKANAAAAKYTGGESITLTKDDPTKTIYAVWMPFFELKYDANGGTGAPASQTRTASAPTVNRVTFTVPGTIPTKDGCTFKGWADSATATDAQYQPGDTVDVKHENSPKTVYAVWQSNTPPIDKPDKPKESDVTGVVVDIVCVTTTGTHDTVQYPLGHPTDAQHTIGEVVSDGAGGYICPVTVRTAWFVQQASNLVWKVQHTPTAQTITFNLTYDKNSKTWVKPAANPRIEATHEVTPPTKPTALDGSFAIVCKNNKATHPYKADYIATPSQYTISDVQMDDQGYYVTATVTVAPNLVAYNTATRAEHRLVNEQDATLTITFRYNPKATGDGNRKWQQQGDLPVVEVICKPKAPTADELKKLEMAVQVKCVVDASQQHTAAYGLLGECDVDYFVFEPRQEGDDWLCDISYYPERYVAEFNTTFQNLKHVQNDEKIVPVTLIWAGGSWQIKTQGRVHVTEEYTVTYTDGVDGEEVFADQVYSDLRKDSTTPAFNGTPTRTGYTFAGWEPEVAATVTQTVTYVAKWEAKKANVHLMIFKSGDLSKPIVDVPYAADKLAGDTIDLTKIDPSSYLDFDFEIDGGWYDDGMFNSYKRYLDGLQDKPAGLEKLLITGNWQNLKLIVTELVPVVYFDSLESLTAYQNDHSKTEGILRTTKARVGSALPTADAPTATRDGYTFTFWSREGQTVDVTGQTVNGWTNVLLKYTITPHNIYAYLRTGDSIGDVLELNEATLNRLGLTKYNTEGFISIGTFVSNTLLTQDEYYGFDEDEAFLDVLAELQTKLVPETGVSLDKVGSKINWSWLYQPSDVDDRIAGYPTEDTDGYQLSGSLLLYGAKFEAGANDVTGMPTAAYGAYLDYFVSGESFNLPAAPTRPGYDFKGWKIGNAVLTAGAAYTVDEDDMVFTAQWEARTDTPYTVEHYLENLDGSYALDTTEHLKGTTDTTVTAAAKSYDNFTYDSTVPDTVASGNIAGDGSLVLKLFYTRNTYDYTVRHIKQLPDGSYDEANAEVETLSGKFEALAAVTAKDYGEHYPTNDAGTKQNIKIEKGLTIDVKYDLDEHTLTFETNGGSAINPVTVRHGNAVARPADPTKDKYTFIGWYADPEFTEEYDFATVLEADKTIYAKFELTSTPIGDIYVRYDVLHIKQLPDGTYDLANAEVEHLSAKKDTTVTAVIKDYRATHHVNVNRTLSKLTGTAIQPYKGVDGKPVYTILSVYYDLDFHTLTFDTMGGSKIAPETVRHGLTVAKPKDPVNGGYIFDGWYTDKTFRHRYDFSTPLTEDITIYAKWFLIVLPGVTVKKNTPKLNTADHFAYVQGYPDGTVKPAGNITRAETAAILFRLMDDASRKTYYSTKSGFRDVASGSWYNTYVATLNNAGVITDSSNGYFRPNEAITRAELAAMLAKFSETTGAANYFNDVSAKYWAANAIAICAKLGWINGYPDGTFRPDKNVTRAELMAMINRATGRAPKSADAFLPGMKTWIDNTSDKWYYLDVQEATNSHSYTVKGSETWTALTSDPNWSLYE